MILNIQKKKRQGVGMAEEGGYEIDTIYVNNFDPFFCQFFFFFFISYRILLSDPDLHSRIMMTINYSTCSKVEINPFSNKPLFSCVCCKSLLKTLWEKEKLLVM